nr:unnamed protein product [Callosobruchus analis]
MVILVRGNNHCHKIIVQVFDITPFSKDHNSDYENSELYLHLDIRNFVCDVCGKSFFRWDALRKPQFRPQARQGVPLQDMR